MSRYSLNNIISKYNINTSVEVLTNLNVSHYDIIQFITRSYNYFTKYSEESIITEEYILKYIMGYINRPRVTKITLDTFNLFGLGENEYRLYCKNKTGTWVKNSAKNAKLGAEAAKQDRKENPEKYKNIQSNQLGYWIKKGYSEEEAKLKLAERQATFSLKKCILKYGETEGLIKFNERQEKWQNSLNSKSQAEIDRINQRKNVLLKKKNESYIMHLIRITRFRFKLSKSAKSEEVKQKIYNTKLKRGNIILDKDRSDFDLYRYKVRKITKQQDINTLSNFVKRGREGSSFQLDHKFSIFEGFKQNIPIYIIGNIINLEMIPRHENHSKGTKCSITMKELFSKFFQC